MEHHDLTKFKKAMRGQASQACGFQDPDGVAFQSKNEACRIRAEKHALCDTKLKAPLPRSCAELHAGMQPGHKTTQTTCNLMSKKGITAQVMKRTMAQTFSPYQAVAPTWSKRPCSDAPAEAARISLAGQTPRRARGTSWPRHITSRPWESTPSLEEQDIPCFLGTMDGYLWALPMAQRSHTKLARVRLSHCDVLKGLG